jgi:cysteinyl-tRNA synthetase
MLKLFNLLGKKIETFKPANRDVVNIFTCGPSVYQRVHIGNLFVKNLVF